MYLSPISPTLIQTLPSLSIYPFLPSLCLLWGLFIRYISVWTLDEDAKGVAKKKEKGSVVLLP